LFSPLFLVALIILEAAGPAETSFPSRHLIEEIPFIVQKKDQCGPASLAMVFGYYRVRISPDDLAEELRIEKMSGSLNLDLLIAARRHGFSARTPPGTIQTLKDYISRDIPVIALVAPDPAEDFFHFLVVYGFDDQTGQFIVHSGRKRALKIGYDEFRRIWEPSRNWMLVVEQKIDFP